MTSLKTSIKTITYLSDTGCLEIQGASLVIYLDISNIYYQVYDSKQSFLNDEYTILHMNNGGGYEAYAGNPLRVSDATRPIQFHIIAEHLKEGKITITKTSPKDSYSNMFSLYPVISVKLGKPFFMMRH
ncbi:hypothetical protein EsCd1HHP024_00590 [Escherichia sp. HH091_1A]|uniref:hypothetical protein n=1 Tax=Escherichia sp. HH091_1A TaxID=2509662 RepID=UPI002573FAE0|nr:hypothetical protein [Escherichia sp. HH091_1A]BDI40104.1 hypothetical protein EsCd1HHP024_00590 [Escherichia sp. HH091_1A]